MKKEMTCGTAIVMLTKRGIAWDSLDNAVQIAMDAKFTNKGKGWKKPEQVKCHAADPNNCRFHHTGKYANAKGKDLFDVDKFGAYNADDIKAFLSEQLEAAGVGVKSLDVSLNAENGQYTVGFEPDGADEAGKAQSIIEDFVFDIDGTSIDDEMWKKDGSGFKGAFTTPESEDAISNGGEEDDADSALNDDILSVGEGEPKNGQELWWQDFSKNVAEELATKSGKSIEEATAALKKAFEATPEGAFSSVGLMNGGDLANMKYNALLELNGENEVDGSTVSPEAVDAAIHAFADYQDGTNTGFDAKDMCCSALNDVLGTEVSPEDVTDENLDAAAAKLDKLHSAISSGSQEKTNAAFNDLKDLVQGFGSGDDGSITGADEPIQDILADAVENAGLSYENPEWDKVDGNLTCTLASVQDKDQADSLAQAIEDDLHKNGYTSASVQANDADGAFTFVLSDCTKNGGATGSEGTGGEEKTPEEWKALAPKVSIALEEVESFTGSGGTNDMELAKAVENVCGVSPLMENSQLNQSSSNHAELDDMQHDLEQLKSAIESGDFEAAETYLNDIKTMAQHLHEGGDDGQKSSYLPANKEDMATGDVVQQTTEAIIADKYPNMEISSDCEETKPGVYEFEVTGYDTDDDPGELAEELQKALGEGWSCQADGSTIVCTTKTNDGAGNGYLPDGYEEMATGDVLQQTTAKILDEVSGASDDVECNETDANHYEITLGDVGSDDTDTVVSMLQEALGPDWTVGSDHAGQIEAVVTAGGKIGSSAEQQEPQAGGAQQQEAQKELAVPASKNLDKAFLAIGKLIGHPDTVGKASEELSKLFGTQVDLTGKDGDALESAASDLLEAKESLSTGDKSDAKEYWKSACEKLGIGQASAAGGAAKTDAEMNASITSEEAGVLDKIAEVSKMDTWFSMAPIEEGGYKVHDQEDDEVYNAKEGIGQLMEGMSESDYDQLDADEKKTLAGVLKKLGIEHPFEDGDDGQSGSAAAAGEPGGSGSPTPAGGQSQQEQAAQVAKEALAKAAAAITSGNGAAKNSKEAGHLVDELHGLMAQAKEFAGGNQDVLDDIEELDSHLGYMDHLQQQIEKASSQKVKDKYQKLLDAAIAESSSMQENLTKKVGAAQKDAIKAAQQQVENGKSDLMAELSDGHQQFDSVKKLSNALFLGLHANINGPNKDGLGTLMKFDEDHTQFNSYMEAKAPVQAAESAYNDALESYQQAAGAENPDAGYVKAMAEKVEQAKKTYIEALQSFKKTALNIQNALMAKKGKSEAAELGVSGDLYDKVMKSFQEHHDNGIANVSAEQDGFKFSMGPDGKLKIEKSGADGLTGGKQKYWENVGAGVAHAQLKGFSNEIAEAALKKALAEFPDEGIDENGFVTAGHNADDMIESAKKIAQEMSTKSTASAAGGAEYSHETASPETKAQQAVKNLEAKVAAAKDPAMKAVYEKVLAKLKAHHGLGDGPDKPDGGGTGGNGGGNPSDTPTGGNSTTSGGGSLGLMAAYSDAAKKWMAENGDVNANNIASELGVDEGVAKNALAKALGEYSDDELGYDPETNSILPSIYPKVMDKAKQYAKEAGGAGSGDGWTPNGSDITGMIEHGFGLENNSDGKWVWVKPGVAGEHELPPGADPKSVQAEIASKAAAAAGGESKYLKGGDAEDVKNYVLSSPEKTTLFMQSADNIKSLLKDKGFTATNEQIAAAIDGLKKGDISNSVGYGVGFNAGAKEKVLAKLSAQIQNAGQPAPVKTSDVKKVLGTGFIAKKQKDGSYALTYGPSYIKELKAKHPEDHENWTTMHEDAGGIYLDDETKADLAKAFPDYEASWKKNGDGTGNIVLTPKAAKAENPGKGLANPLAKAWMDEHGENFIKTKANETHTSPAAMKKGLAMALAETKASDFTNDGGTAMTFEGFTKLMDSSTAYAQTIDKFASDPTYDGYVACNGKLFKKDGFGGIEEIPASSIKAMNENGKTALQMSKEKPLPSFIHHSHFSIAGTDTDVPQPTKAEKDDLHQKLNNSWNIAHVAAEAGVTKDKAKEAIASALESCPPTSYIKGSDGNWGLTNSGITQMVKEAINTAKILHGKSAAAPAAAGGNPLNNPAHYEKGTGAFSKGAYDKDQLEFGKAGKINDFTSQIGIEFKPDSDDCPISGMSVTPSGYTLHTKGGNDEKSLNVAQGLVDKINAKFGNVTATMDLTGDDHIKVNVGPKLSEAAKSWINSMASSYASANGCDNFQAKQALSAAMVEHPVKFKAGTDELAPGQEGKEIEAFNAVVSKYVKAHAAKIAASIAKFKKTSRAPQQNQQPDSAPEQFWESMPDGNLKGYMAEKTDSFAEQLANYHQTDKATAYKALQSAYKELGLTDDDVTINADGYHVLPDAKFHDLESKLKDKDSFKKLSGGSSASGLGNGKSDDHGLTKSDYTAYKNATTKAHSAAGGKKGIGLGIGSPEELSNLLTSVKNGGNFSENYVKSLLKHGAGTKFHDALSKAYEGWKHNSPNEKLLAENIGLNTGVFSGLVDYFSKKKEFKGAAKDAVQQAVHDVLETHPEYIEPTFGSIPKPYAASFHNEVLTKLAQAGQVDLPGGSGKTIPHVKSSSGHKKEAFQGVMNAYKQLPEFKGVSDNDLLQAVKHGLNQMPDAADKETGAVSLMKMQSLGQEMLKFLGK